MDIRTEEERIEEANRYKIDRILAGSRTQDLEQIVKKWEKIKAEFAKQEMIRRKKSFVKDIEVMLRNDFEKNHLTAMTYTYREDLGDEYIYMIWADDAAETLLITGMSYEMILKTIVMAVYE